MNESQAKELEQILFQNKEITFILKSAPILEMPNWYLASGCVIQTVWNALHGFDPNFGINDYDLVYYDSDNISYEAEDKFIKKGEKIFNHLSAPVEIRNQARVHLWFGDHFGYQIKPYKSVEDAIGSWSTQVNCVGINSVNGKLNIYSPYGLDDLFYMIIRPNMKTIFTKELYDEKVHKWVQKWPKLKVIPWQ